MTETTTAPPVTSGTSSVWLSDDEQRIWRQWRSATTRIDSELARRMQKNGSISMSDYAVLVSLSEAEDQRMRVVALADQLQWDRSRLSHQISRMARRGLIRREGCPRDGRGSYVVIEDLGLDLLAAAAPGHVADVRELLFAHLSEEELAQLDAITAPLQAQFTEA